MKSRNPFFLFLIIIMFVLVLLFTKPTMADDFGRNHDHPTNVPEPSSLVMLASGLVGLAGFSRLRRK